MSQSKDNRINSIEADENSVEFLNGSSTRRDYDSGPDIETDTLEFMQKLTKEIEDEVKQKRAMGAFPPAFERRLRLIFEQLIPAGSGNSRKDFEALIRSSDRAAYFDIDVPTASQKPGVAQLKKLLRKTQAWYLNYLTQQLNNFSTNLMRLLYVFDSRVKRLEDSIESKYRTDPRGNIIKPYYPNVKYSAEILLELSKIKNRVLVSDCGNGKLVSELVHDNIDAYGIDSSGDLLDNPIEKTLDLRWENLPEHLSEIADDTLGAVFLQGSIDLLATIDKFHVILESLRVIEDGGLLAILSVDPQFFISSPDLTIQRELSPGQPFSIQTWSYVLEKLGLSTIKSIQVKDSYIIWGIKATSSKDRFEH